MARGEEARVRIPFAVVTLALLSACDAPSGGEAPPKASTAPIASAPLASATVSAAPPKPAAPADPLAGTWQGGYDAKKGAVSLPPKVKDKALASDDGKASAGAGTVELTIGADGEVRGKSSGALGACTLVGRADEGTLRATVNPDDPRAPNAMTGVLIGKLTGDVIKAELHVAGPDATVVRESAVELKRK